jgi:hypothetical protein
MDRNTLTDCNSSELQQIMNVMKRDQNLQRTEERRLM